MPRGAVGDADKIYRLAGTTLESSVAAQMGLPSLVNTEAAANLVTNHNIASAMSRATLGGDCLPDNRRYEDFVPKGSVGAGFLYSVVAGPGRLQDAR